jgi:hypothetical protein
MTTIIAKITLLTTIQAAITTGLLSGIHHPDTTTDTTGIPGMVETLTVVTTMAIRADTTAVVIEVRMARTLCTDEPQKGTCKF